MKKRRLERILKLISERDVTTQEELLVLLKRDGFDVTQATVSRDIKELRIIKVTDGNGVMKYAPMSGVTQKSPQYVGIFSSSVISITSAMNDIVIKCYPGMANAACTALDNMNFNEVLGTLAGDDTIFIITKSSTAAAVLAQKLSKLK